MIHIIMAFLAFLLALPLLIYLPLGLSLKGKLLIALQCLAAAIGGIMLSPYLPLWQTGLLVFLIVLTAGYLTVKYGVANWAIDNDNDWEEGDGVFAFLDLPDEETNQPHKLPIREETEEMEETEEISESDELPAMPVGEEDDYIESLFYGEQDDEIEMDTPSIPNEETHYLEELFDEGDDSNEDMDIPLLHFEDKKE